MQTKIHPNHMTTLRMLVPSPSVGETKLRLLMVQRLALTITLRHMPVPTFLVSHAALSVQMIHAMQCHPTPIFTMSMSMRFHDSITLTASSVRLRLLPRPVSCSILMRCCAPSSSCFDLRVLVLAWLARPPSAQVRAHVRLSHPAAPSMRRSRNVAEVQAHPLRSCHPRLACASLDSSAAEPAPGRRGLWTRRTPDPSAQTRTPTST